MADLIPKLMTIKEASEATGGKVSTWSLREAVRRGELNAIRTSEACSAKILLEEAEVATWIRERCSGRNIVPSTREAGAAKRQAEAAEQASC